MNFELKTVVEALLFASTQPLTAEEMAMCFKEAAKLRPCEETGRWAETDEAAIREAVEALRQDYQGQGRALVVQEVAHGFQIRTAPGAVDWVSCLLDHPKETRLSQPAMETLAIVAYRQPISRAEMEAVRGVAVDGVVATLLERKLVRIAGRADAPGRPLLYETTEDFLQEFGLKDLEGLPNVEELRRLIGLSSKPASVPASATESSVAPEGSQERSQEGAPEPAESEEAFPNHESRLASPAH